MTSFNPNTLEGKLNTMTARVKAILLDTPSARSSDKILIITYWRRYGPLVYDEQSKKLTFREADGVTYENFLKIPSTESICRIRRDVQHQAKLAIKQGYGTEQDAMLLPSQRVAEQRAILEEIQSTYYMR